MEEWRQSRETREIYLAPVLRPSSAALRRRWTVRALGLNVNAYLAL